jgi:hypothetical protein
MEKARKRKKYKKCFKTYKVKYYEKEIKMT